jgi:hypothetical protein
MGTNNMDDLGNSFIKIGCGIMAIPILVILIIILFSIL